jgi:hypothetical protein
MTNGGADYGGRVRRRAIGQDAYFASAEVRVFST